MLVVQVPGHRCISVGCSRLHWVYGMDARAFNPNEVRFHHSDGSGAEPNTAYLVPVPDAAHHRRPDCQSGTKRANSPVSERTGSPRYDGSADPVHKLSKQYWRRAPSAVNSLLTSDL